MPRLRLRPFAPGPGCPDTPVAPTAPPKRLGTNTRYQTKYCETLRAPSAELQQILPEKRDIESPPFDRPHRAPPRGQWARPAEIAYYEWEKISDDVKSRNRYQFWDFGKKFARGNLTIFAYHRSPCESLWNLQLIAYDHTTMNTPVLVWSRKLSIVGPG